MFSFFAHRPLPFGGVRLWLNALPQAVTNKHARVCLSVSVYLSTRLPVYLSIHSSSRLSICLSVYLSTRLSTHPFIWPSVYPSVSVCLCLSDDPRAWGAAAAEGAADPKRRWLPGHAVRECVNEYMYIHIDGMY